MNRNCSACNIMIDENNYLKHWTICKKCHNENRRKNKINIITEKEQPKIDKINNNDVSTFENHACVVIGPRYVGKTITFSKYLKK